MDPKKLANILSVLKENGVSLYKCEAFTVYFSEQGQAATARPDAGFEDISTMFQDEPDLLEPIPGVPAAYNNPMLFPDGKRPSFKK